MGIGVCGFDSSTRQYPVLISYDHVIKSSLLRNSLEPYTAIGAGRWFLGTRIDFSRADDRFDQRDGWSVRVYVCYEHHRPGFEKIRRHELRMSCMRHIRASEGSGAALAATAVEFEPTASKTQDWLLPAAPSIPFVGWG